LGFRIKIAPGVRIRVSSRGVRTSIGPRIARVHVGAGRTGFSTGVGPFTYYTSGGKRYRTSSGGGGYSSYYSNYGTSGRTQYEKREAAVEIEKALKLWTMAHLRDFPAATKAMAKMDSVASLAEILKIEKKKQLVGISLFKFAERKVAKELALTIASEDKAHRDSAALSKQIQEQEEIDEAWQHLVECEPSRVFEVITAAFGDNESKAAVIDVEDTAAEIITLVPAIDVIPEKDRGTTAAGNLSVKNMTVGARNSYYLELFQSQTLATVKEAFAVAPGLTHVKIVVIRAEQTTGQNEAFECLGFGTFARSALKSALQLQRTTGSAIYAASSDWRQNTNAKLQVLALNLAKEKDIQTLLTQLADTDKAQATKAAKHIGVSVKLPAKESRVASGGPQMLDASKVADEEIAIAVADFCMQRDQVGHGEIASKFNLSAADSKKVLYFLELVGAVTKPNTEGVRQNARTPYSVEQIHESIRLSISFRRMP